MSNAAVLATARLADPLVMMFGWTTIIAALLWVEHGRTRHAAVLFLSLFAIILFYVPGAIYFYILLGVLYGNRIIGFVRDLPNRTLIIGASGIFLGISLLLQAFLVHPELIRAWLLIPENFQASEIGKNLLSLPSSYFYHAKDLPLLNVGNLPVLNIASIGLFILGLFNFWRNRKLERTKLLAVVMLVSAIVAALGSTIFAVTLFMPYSFIVIASGITFFLDNWYSVFPKNPLARTFGFILISAVVFSSGYYQVKKFFVVWPNTPATQETYNQPSLLQ